MSMSTNKQFTLEEKIEILPADVVNDAEKKAKEFETWSDCPHITGTIPEKGPEGKSGGRAFRKNQPGDRCSYDPETAIWLRDEHNNFVFAFESPQKQMFAHFIGRAFRVRNRQLPVHEQMNVLRAELEKLKAEVAA